MSKEISGTTEWIFLKISGLVELYKDLINPASFGDCSRDVAMTTN